MSHLNPLDTSHRPAATQAARNASPEQERRRQQLVAGAHQPHETNGSGRSVRDGLNDDGFSRQSPVPSTGGSISPFRSQTFGQPPTASVRAHAAALDQCNRAFGSQDVARLRLLASQRDEATMQRYAALIPHVQQNPRSGLHQALRAGCEMGERSNQQRTEQPLSPFRGIISRKRKSHDLEGRPADPQNP